MPISSDTTGGKYLRLPRQPGPHKEPRRPPWRTARVPPAPTAMFALKRPLQKWEATRLQLNAKVLDTAQTERRLPIAHDPEYRQPHTSHRK